MKLDPLALCLSYLAKQQGRLYSTQALTANLPIESGLLDSHNFVEAAARAGFYAEFKATKLDQINPIVLPAILLLDNGQAVVLLRKQNDMFEIVELSDDPSTHREASPIYENLKQLNAKYSGHAIYLKDIFNDKGDEIRQYVEALSGKTGWFRKVLFRFKGLYFNVAIASLMTNIIGLISALYVMNVYDRVIPNQAESTLLALSLGVFIAYVFDFILKTLRAYFIDLAGKKADIILSSTIFSAVMNVRLDNRPGSSGSFANVIRDFDSVRDFFTSSTLTAFVDIPFVTIYIVVVFMIGGPLGYVIAGAALCIFILNLILQRPLARLVNENLKEGSYKHSVLIESLSGLEQVKSLHAQGVMRGKWEKVTGTLATNSMKTKFLNALATNFTSFVQQFTTVVLVFSGCYEVFEGNLTMGGLIACVILVGRATAPLGQVTNLATRYQSMRFSLQNIDEFLQRDNELSLDKSLLARPVLTGAFKFDGVTFSYPDQSRKALDDVTFKVEAGEKIAFLGKNGSGKTSVLRLLMDFYKAQSGRVLLDGVDSNQLDVSDIRHNISYVAQNPSLFIGSLRDNILMAHPTLSEDEFHQLLQDTNLLPLIQNQDQGLDLQVGELGGCLSGGQRQMVALAAAIANDGNIVLMDEPTSSLDKGMEIDFIKKMKRRLKHKTLLISTHEPALLALVERIIILDAGKIVMDGKKENVLKALAENQSQTMQAQS